MLWDVVFTKTDPIGNMYRANTVGPKMCSYSLLSSLDDLTTCGFDLICFAMTELIIPKHDMSRFALSLDLRRKESYVIMAKGVISVCCKCVDKG